MFYKFLDFNGRLTEGIKYDIRLNRLYWVDIIAVEIHFVHLLDYSPIRDYSEAECFRIQSTHRVYSLQDVTDSIGFIGLTTDPGTLIVAISQGYGLYNLSSETFTLKANYPQHDPTMRSNDGMIDVNGNIWIGTMSDFRQQTVEPKGKLYMIDGSGITAKIENASISNGLRWNNGKLYWIDSLTFKLWCFDCKDSKTLSNRRPFIDFKTILPEVDSPEPDGFTIAENGDFFVSVYNSQKVLRFDRRGQLTDAYSFPAKRITCCCIGGINMDELFVTSANLNIKSPQKFKSNCDDQGGALFRVKLDIKGNAENYYSLSTTDALLVHEF
ncbi:BA75_02335T0 [Komagataella pastoris]|uniref:BA75_02335T0 n=1 Tax=Komagataella pastoris TaxID=4922 RepID=A0A1B2JB71_PICPA|nr:BA75_02335T0 [Komagataella pastoris]